jgi:hypothetical protein
VNADGAFLAADAEDRRAALAAAAEVASHRGDADLITPGSTSHWLALAERAYRWLRDRSTLHAVSVQIIPGTPYPEGTMPVTATYTLDDTDEVVFTLTGQDAKGAAVPLPAGYTASWSLADPDSTGAVLTPSADTTSATLAAGTPDTNLMVSVTVTITNADGSTTTLTGAEAVIVQATAATTVGLVAATPSAETPAAPAT